MVNARTSFVRLLDEYIDARVDANPRLCNGAESEAEKKRQADATHKLQRLRTGLLTALDDLFDGHAKSW